MITCPECQHENVDGTQFCENCGEELPSLTAALNSEAMMKCPDCGAQNPVDNLACEACGADLHPGAGVVTTPPVSPIDEPMDTTNQTAPITSLDMPADETSLGNAPAASSASAGLSAPVSTGATSPAGATFDLTEADLKKPTDSNANLDAPQSAGDLMPGNVKLVVEQGQSVGAQFVLGDAQMLVGREDEDADIYPDIDLSDQDAGYVHRQHAQIRFDNGNLTVTHLGGANKTRVNNKPIGDNQPSPLKLGDKVAFGKVVLRLLPV